MSHYRLYYLCTGLLLSLLLFSPVIKAQGEAQLTMMAITARKADTPSQITLTFNHPVDYKTFTLPKPSRFIIDLKGVLYTFTGAKTLDFSNTPVTDFRHGIQNGTDLRLVFDLNTPVQYHTETSSAQGYQITILLLPSVLPAETRQENKQDIRQDNKSDTANTALAVNKINKPNGNNSDDENNNEDDDVTDNGNDNENNKGDDAPVAISSSPAVLPAVTTPVPDKTVAITPLSSRPGNKHIFTVVIDAGHGGKDPGTTGPSGVKEKNVTLAIARDLQTLVNKTPDMHAVMTRSGDYYVGLRERLMLARKARGDIFIAIHADAYTDAYAQGASIFALSLHGASSEAALWLANKENYSELSRINLDGIQDQDAQVRSVLIDLSQTATIGASLQLGKDIIRQLGDMTNLHRGFVEQAPFMVLKSPDIPSILVETGFLSNPTEESRLNNTDYQKKIANALFVGLKQYFSQTAPRNLSVIRRQ